MEKYKGFSELFSTYNFVISECIRPQKHHI